MFNKTNSHISTSSQFLHSNLFPNRAIEQLRRSKICFSSYKKHQTKSVHISHTNDKDEQNRSMNQSKTINLQFNNNAKLTYPQNVLLRRRLMSTSQKFYNKKKTILFNFIKQKNQNYDAMINEGRKFLKIGAHQITKIDFNRLEEERKNSVPKERSSKILFRKRATQDKMNRQRHDVFFSQSNSVVIIQRKLQSKQSQSLISTQAKMPKSSQHPRIKFKNKTEPTTCQQKQTRCDYEQFIPIINKKIKKQPFIFGLSDKSTAAQPEKYKQKLIIYHDYLWKVNFSNGLFVKIQQTEPQYKYYVGPGNNCNLIKSIIRKRYWWMSTDKPEQANFVWTQLKINSIYKDKQTTFLQQNFQIPEQSGQISQEIANTHNQSKIFNKIDLFRWIEHISKNAKSQNTVNEKTYKNRNEFYRSKDITRIQNSHNLILHNHLQSNFYIGNKKALFYFLKNYCEQINENVFNIIPLTYHIVKGLDDNNYKQFLKIYKQLQAKKDEEDVKNIWIIKPGENSNRGNGITVCHSLDDIKIRLNGREKNSDGNLRTFILQKYIERPLLFKGRKFDIRHYLLISCFKGAFKAYWFPEGYIRTSSTPFSLRKTANLFVHLTNDAIQKNSTEYGKYQKGNKVSYEEMNEYLSKQGYQELYFSNKILPTMKKQALLAIKSTYLHLDKQRKQHNFQLLGMDFMVDQGMNPWLIEINTNPCLQLSCPLLARIIPNLLQQTFRVCIDPFFPPPAEWNITKKMYFGENPLQQLEFELLFDESQQGKQAEDLLKTTKIEKVIGKVDDEAQTFENEGELQQEAQ